MSQAIAQSATQLTVSNGASDWDEEMFEKRAALIAKRKINGTTRERQMLNRNKLITGLVADYRTHFAALYGKTDRLPSPIFEKIETACDKVINTHLARINPSNVLSFRRGFYHNANEMEITERCTATGENKLTLQEQHLGCNLFIGQAEKRLKDLEAKPTPDLDREKQVKEQLMRLNITLQFIEGEIAHQKKLETETK